MIITDYYKFAKLPDTKSKLRIDCISSSQSYNTFEQMRNKKDDLFMYIGDNTYTKAGTNNKSDLALSKNSHISSIYIPDIKQNYWYGDVKNTADALLFVPKNAKYINGSFEVGTEIEVFVARGQRNNRKALYDNLSDGTFDDEIKYFREQAKTEKNL